MRAYEVLRAPMVARYARSRVEIGLVPYPFDEPSSRSGHPDPDRMLLIGNGPCHGWGVSSHQLAMTGQLGRVLGRRTGRGLDVDFVGDETMNMASARQWVGDRASNDYDVILVEIGMNDAMRLTSEKRWQLDLAALLHAVLGDSATTARVIVAGIPRLRSFSQYDDVWGRVGQRHADRLNAVTQQLTAPIPRVQYIDWPVPEFEPGRPHGSTDFYERTATLLADHLVPALDDVAALRDRPRARVTAAPVWDWEATPRAVELARTGGMPQLQRLIDAAKDQFGVDVASVNLIDGDRNWFATNSGGVPVSVPRELVYCNVAIEQDEPFIVPDARLDARFRDNPFLQFAQLPFYAGQTVHSRSGRPIGAVCLLGSTPRAASTIELDQLRALTLQVEHELQLLEQDTTLEGRADRSTTPGGFDLVATEAGE